MERLATEFVSGFEAVHGYPPDEHTVCLAPAGEGAVLREALARQGVAGPLLEYYGHLGAVELPDLDNGIWIDDGPSFIAQIETGNYPNRLTSAVDDTVSVFATDGGGGMYALSHTTGRIYHLTAGALIQTPTPSTRPATPSSPKASGTSSSNCGSASPWP
ncbi:hypothetical protein [Streptomyces sp. WMMC940]|uniref:hypothetical protein n=1 Tax=Streptomyces sp. WMMC940 TaxID=3015153 RepID=UPI0022B71779|nr:hypothetical protein [Streptomyces sp. WMMC940]MCZ7456090.1 hypothetical protein [Streptomyces sp. WMMC940]